MISKTVILSKTNSTSKAILTLYLEDDLLKGKLRLYNCNLNNDCKLGLYHEKQVYSANLLFKNNIYETSFVGEFDMTKDFYCAVVDTSNKNEILLSGGTYSGYFFNDESIFSTIDNNDNFDEPRIEKESLQECPNCEMCKYKKYFYEQNSLKDIDEIVPQSTTSNVQNNIPPVANPETLTKDLIPHFEYIFTHYPIDNDLCNLIVNSKFVKISENSSEYSIGAIFENDKMKYICYAQKANYNDPVPAEIGKHYQWLPTNNIDPLSDGYYVVYQDANDLKIIEI